MSAQNDRLLAELKAGKAVTPLDALRRLSIGRLAARVLELKQEGVQIESEYVEVTNGLGEACRVKKYWMARA